MAKIVVYEDGPDDLISRYSTLTKDHEVQVRHPSGYAFSRSEMFKKFGFDPNRFYSEYGKPLDEKEADVYFLDGLNGMCFDFISELPPKKVFINSSSEHINNEARRRGLNIVGDRPIEDIVKEIISNDK